MTGALGLERGPTLVVQLIERVLVSQVADGKQTARSKSPLAGGEIFSGGCSGRFQKIGSCPQRAAWRSSRFSLSFLESRPSSRFTGSSLTQPRLGNIYRSSPDSYPVGFCK